MRYLDIDTATRISNIGLGTWQFRAKEWGYGDGYAGPVARDIVRRDLERSQRIPGEALGERRGPVFPATKLFPVLPLAPVVEQRAVASASRLGTRLLDLYQVHWPPGGPRPRRTYCRSPPGPGRVVIAYSPLAQGLLSGRYDRTNRPAHRVRAGNPLFLPANLDRASELIGVLREVADAHTATPAQVALAWVVRHPAVTAIPGASSVEPLESNRFRPVTGAPQFPPSSGPACADESACADDGRCPHALGVPETGATWASAERAWHRCAGQRDGCVLLTSSAEDGRVQL